MTLRRRMPRSVGLAVAATLVTAAGCTGPEVIAVAVDGGSAAITVGEVLRVDFGDVNESIGDSWYLVTPPDPGILGDNGRDYDSACDMSGCGSRLWWDFPGVGPGATTLVFRYCYRSRPDNCQPEPSRGPTEPVTLNVVVEAG
jgi:hypothetical protein